MSGAGPGSTRVAAAAMLRRALDGDAARAGPHLLVTGGDGTERAVALGVELTVGRVPSATLRLEDPGSSRLHARLRLGRQGDATVEDLGSKNGLALNGRRVAPGPAPLHPGDELLIGTTRLRYVDPLAGPRTPAPAALTGAGDARAVREPWTTWRLLAAAAALLAAAALAAVTG